MAKEKSILQEAILEAKQVREAAINQAYESLKENLTPAIKSMLESKLEEDLNLDEEELEESANSGFKEVKVSAPKNTKLEEAEEDETDEDVAEDEAEDAEDDAETAEDDAEEVEQDAEKAEDKAEDAEDAAEEAEDEEEAAEEEELADDTKIEDLTVGDLKDIIANLISQSGMSAPAPEGDMGVDMEVADVEGTGEEEAPTDDDAADTADVVDAAAAVDVEDEETGEDEEIDLAELLKELEDEDKEKAGVCPKCKQKPCVCENDIVPTDKRGKQHDRKVGPGKCQDGETEDIEEVLKKKDKEIKELKEGLAKLTGTLKNINLTNGKLQYVTRLLSEHNLSESQKATVIRVIDKAKTVKEVKTIYNTLVESLNNAKSKILREHRGSASRPTGTSTRGNIVDADETVRRMQFLAGIIK